MESSVEVRPRVCVVRAHNASAAWLCRGLDGSVAIMGLFKGFSRVNFTCHINNWPSEKISAHGTI